MKRKTKTYILAAAVLGIWGTIIFKILSGTNTSEDLPIASQDIGVFIPEAHKAQDTFSIALVERDPFLGTLITKPKKRALKKTLATPQITEDDPTMTFEGVIKKQSSNKQVFVITINGEQSLLKKGQTLDGITLVKGHAKGITVRYNGRTKRLKLN